MTNLPITGAFTVTATYGQVNKKLWSTYHKGLDIVSNNKSIYATCDGTVYNTGYDANGWGYWVSIKDAKGQKHIFCHLVKGSIKVSKGDKVNRSTVIGTMGATGNVTGVHLHYQINDANGKDVNPCDYLGIPNEKGNYDSADYPLKEVDTVAYKDQKKIPEWAKDAVEEVTKDGLMIGDDQGNFNPNEPVTRAELAVVLARQKKL